jgi:hypothetical protein
VSNSFGQNDTFDFFKLIYLSPIDWQDLNFEHLDKNEKNFVNRTLKLRSVGTLSLTKMHRANSISG